MRFRIKISAGFILLVAIIIFFGDGMLILAALPAIAVHELGHICAMHFCGTAPRRLTMTAAGLCLDYSDELHGTREAFSALAGPAAGLIFACICSSLGNALGSEYLLLCAGIGLILNIFNLLPALPLDGGRALKAALCGQAHAEKISDVCTFTVSFVLLLTGLGYISRGQGAGIFIAGIWLIIPLISASKRRL